MEDSPENSSENNINIQLGDILNFIAPENLLYNNKQFFVKYVDSNKIVVINIENNDLSILQLLDGQFDEDSIISIELLSRDDSPSYAIQNNLVPGTWVNLHFDIEIPFILTGEITNLEQDMIEIKTYPKNDVIYIDFEYKGIPESLQIEKIIIRGPPTKSIKQSELPGSPAADALPALPALPESSPGSPASLGSQSLSELPQLPDSVDSANLVDSIANEEDNDMDNDMENDTDVSPTDLNEILLDADQIIMGKKLDDITLYIDVPDNEMRYSINKQTNDLLDELLADIPNYKRTPAVLNDIHLLIERYVQLRNLFSNFDDNGNANKPDALDDKMKPIIEKLLNLNKNFTWLLPVSQNKKKLYNIDDSIFSFSDINDITTIDQRESLESEFNTLETYKNSDLSDEENKYLFLFKALNELDTPFTESYNQDNGITTQTVNENILSMTNNIDNLFSSVAANMEGKIESTQYYFDIYSKSITYLKDNTLHPITNNDTINIKSFLVFPLQVLLYSRKKVPTTNILEKSELDNMDFAYWKIFNKNTNVRTIIINDLLLEDYYREQFIIGIQSNVITEFILNEDLWDNEDKYKKYLDNIIPNNLDILNLLKNSLNMKLSVHSIIQFLDILEIEHTDITYNLYTEINNIVEENIIKYNQNYLANYKKLNKLTLKKEPTRQKSKLLEILSINESLEKIILDTYNFNSDIIYSDSEVLSTILEIDFGNLLTIGIIKIDLELQTNNLVNGFVKKYEQFIAQKSDAQNNCKTISKQYNNIEALQNDSKKAIYFDSMYDKTKYNLFKEYEKKKKDLSPEEFNQYLIDKFVDTHKMTIQDATREANAIIIGKRLVQDGDFAILEEISEVTVIPTPDKDTDIVKISPTTENQAKSVISSTPENHEGISEANASPTYYIRKNDEWVIDNPTTAELGNLGVSPSVNTLCNLQERCISDNSDKCDSFETSENKIIENTLTAIYEEFDETYGAKEDSISSRIDNLLLENIKRIKYLKRYEQSRFYRYDLLKRKLAENIIDEEEELEDQLRISPHEQLKNLILGQSDELKKHYDIRRFVVHFTRKAYEHEDQYWLYCRKTSVKLLPTFISHLANIYVLNGDYQYELDVVCANQGTISEDGEAWIDKYSGQFIKKIDFDNEEGYTEEGFKLKTRDILAADLGDAILDGKITKPKTEIDTAETKMIKNIILAIAGNMGINLDSEREFIIQKVISTHKVSIIKKDTYNKKIAEAQKKGRTNIPSYEEYINSSYVLLTLVFILIGIQVSIPSIKSRKTFPGCIKSFTGFPFYGDDKSAITYIACIATKIKSSAEPWNSIRKLNQDKIIKQMESNINKYILKDQNITEKFNEKRKYLKAQSEDIVLELDTQKLTYFYPPLLNFNIVGLINISEAFKTQLKNNIISGSSNQLDQILSIKSKIIFYGLSIQEKIQKIISKKSALITNNALEPFLENTCCDSKSTNVHQYFIDIDKTLLTDNNIIKELDNILYDLNNQTRAPLYYYSTDKKHSSTEIPSSFSQNTIYRAFILFCNNKSLILNDDIRAICQLDSENIYNKTIDEQIVQLKEDGVHYSEELLQQLLRVINLKNTVHIDLNIIPQNSVKILEDILTTIESTKQETQIPKEFIKHFKEILDTYGIKSIDNNESTRSFRNYLANSNNTMLVKIETFIKNNSNLSKTKFKQFMELLENITTFVESGDNIYVDSKDETTYKMINFIKDSINNIVDIFPNIILNKLNKSSISIPKHWKLSQKHNMDIKEIVNKYYYKLNQFYTDKDYVELLKNIQPKCANIQLLAKYTPFFLSFNDGKQEINSIFDRRLLDLLYKFYFLTVINSYIGLTEKTFHGGASESAPEDDNEDNEDTNDEDNEDTNDEDTNDETEKEAITNVEATETLEEDVEEDLEEDVEEDVEAIASNVDIETLEEDTDSDGVVGVSPTPSKLSLLLITFIDILTNGKDSNKNIINHNYESILEKVLRSREKEKDIITDHLKGLTDEAREIENILKNNKLEQWGKGLQKGLTQYVQENYDEERETLEQQAIKDKNLGLNSDVTDMNRDIYRLDLENEDANAEEIENEEYDLSGLPEDDDYGDGDGDENY